MENLKNNYLLLVILLALIGLGFQYYSTSFEITYENIEIIEDGNIVPKSILKPHYLVPIFGMVSAFFITLAISIFVAIFILKKIEEREDQRSLNQLEEVQKNINEDVFNTLFKTLVPEEIYEVIKNQVIKSQLVRKNAVWLYDFISLEEGGFELKQTLKSEIHNIGNRPYTESYKFSFKSSKDISESKLVKFICEYKGNLIAEESANDSDFGDDGEHDIPLEIPPGEHADITVIFKTIYKGTEVADSYFSSQALVNATLIANYPKGYRFGLFGSFSSDMRETSSDESSAIFELKGAILPGQGMSFYLLRGNS